MKYFLFVIVQFFIQPFIHSLQAQTPPSYSSAEIYLQIKKLNVLGSVLYIAAHPDDENTRLLAYMSKEKLFRTGYLSLTRGDGGQNLIGNEQGVELGLIRTQELLAARRIDGAEQFFSRAYDFGYSKSAEETLKFWNKEKVLSDVVWVIRKFKPDVIITRFPGDERAGHGHHTTSALLANEAFTAAADPQRFSEQFAWGVAPWQAKRIVWNTFNFGGNNTTSEDQLKLDVGTFNALLGKGYGELASESRSQHKSQGFGVPRQRGVTYEYFVTTGGDAPTKDLFEGINTDWSRIEGGAAISEMIAALVKSYSFEHPEFSLPVLMKLHETIRKMKPGYWQMKKLQEIQQLIEYCSGLFAEVVTNQEYGVQGDSVKLNILFNNRSGAAAKVNTVSVLSAASLLEEQRKIYRSMELTKTLMGTSSSSPMKDSSINKVLVKNENVIIPFAFKLEDDATISQPYWLTNGIKGGYFDISDPLLIGRPENMAPFTLRADIEMDGQHFMIERPLMYKYTDPVKGELYQPFVILPKFSITVSPGILVNNRQMQQNSTVTIQCTSNVNESGVSASFAFKNDHFKETVFNRVFNFTRGKDTVFDYSLSKQFIEEKDAEIEPSLITRSAGKEQNFSMLHKSIRYDHIPAIHYFYTDKIKVLNQEVKIAGKRIGYIAGAGDRVPEALQAMGYTVDVLEDKDIVAEDLKKFDALITGIRAYNVHEFLKDKYNILMSYVNNGGNLIVQYNTNNQLGSLKYGMGPFPFTISRTRVSDEHAEVTISDPGHSVFNYPNKISARDFDNWVQERSIYQAEGLDSNYVAPIVMNDPKEKPSNGSLIMAKYGKGNFVYTGLVFFRQLPAGVSGAYRLLANLIALPKNK